MKRNISDLYSPHILSGRRASSKPQKRFFILIFLLCLMIAAVVLGLVLYKPFNIHLKQRDYYLLVLHRTSLTEEADLYSREVSFSGGSGYIINDGEFLVTAFAYKSKSDAEAVRSRMADGYKDASVKKIGFKGYKIKRFGDRKNEKKLENLLNYPFELLQRMTDLVYRLDSFESTESAVLLEVEGLKKTIEKNIDEAKALAKAYPDLPAAAKIAGFLDITLLNLEDAASLEPSAQKLTGRVKKYVCKTVCDYSGIWRDLSGKK